MLDASAGTFWIFLCLAFVGIGAVSFLAGRWWTLLRSPRAAVASTLAPFETTMSSDATSAPATVDSLVDAWLVRLAADARPWLLLQGAGAERRLLRANRAALRLLDSDDTAIGTAWGRLEGGAPAALRHAIADADSAGAWWHLRLGAGTAERSLLLGPDDDGSQAETASLVYTVSHDLRAPIRVVEGFTRIVKEDYAQVLDRVGHDHLDRVLAAGARMNQMIDAMLTMARLAAQPLVSQPVDLSQLARYVVDELQRGTPERQVELKIEPDLRARGDPTLLRLVLENLLGNAFKYSARNPAARIEFACSQAEGRSVFAVRDNGAGFDMRGADRLFGLFQRLHSAKDFSGTGVGLASVRRIVRRHGGEIWAEAEPGRGATFFFTLRA